MEDAATAEISRSQVWQQIRNDVRLSDTGETVTRDLVSRVLDAEVDELRGEVPADQFERFYRPAAELVRHLCLDEDFVDFLTLPAYELVT
jgi:malate synthase